MWPSAAESLTTGSSDCSNLGDVLLKRRDVEFTALSYLKKLLSASHAPDTLGYCFRATAGIIKTKPDQRFFYVFLFVSTGV